MPSVNVSKLQFYSGYPIDKITQQGTASFTVAGSTSPSTPTYSTQSIPNTLGLKAFVNSSWSTDTLNYQDQGTATYFSSTFFGGAQILSFQVQGGCDASNIYFFMQNGLSNGSGAAVSQTVTISYAVYSIS